MFLRFLLQVSLRLFVNCVLLQSFLLEHSPPPLLSPKSAFLAKEGKSFQIEVSLLVSLHMACSGCYLLFVTLKNFTGLLVTYKWRKHTVAWTSFNRFLQAWMPLYGVEITAAHIVLLNSQRMYIFFLFFPVWIWPHL